MSALQVPHTCYRWAPVCHWDWMPIPCWGEACSSGYACFCLLWWSPEHSAGGGQGHLPSLLRPQFRCTPNPSWQQVLLAVVLRAHTSQVGRDMTKSKLSQGPSQWFWFPVSIHLQLLALLQPELPHPWRKVLLRVSRYPMTCSSGVVTPQPTGSFRWYSAEGVEYWQQWKNQLQHNFFYSSLVELAVTQDAI